MPHVDDIPMRRRLSTTERRRSSPNRGSSRRSRTRRESCGDRSRSWLRSAGREHERSRSRRELERKLERERVCVLEEEVRMRRNRSQRATGSLSTSVDQQFRNEAISDRRACSPTVHSVHRDQNDTGSHASRQEARRNNRSDSPTFSSKDVVDLLKSLG